MESKIVAPGKPADRPAAPFGLKPSQPERRKMSNKFTTGLIAGTIGFFVFTVMTGFGLMGKRPAQSTDRQHLPPSKEASVVASEVVGNVQPWPECAKIIATIKGELGDPGSLEIVSWKKAFHDYKTGRERTD